MLLGELEHFEKTSNEAILANVGDNLYRYRSSAPGLSWQSDRGTGAHHTLADANRNKGEGRVLRFPGIVHRFRLDIETAYQHAARLDRPD